MAFSTYMANKIIDHMFRNQAYTPPATIYLALFTTDPTDEGTGTEVSGGSYARQSVALDAASGGATANTSTVTFPTATAAWGTITHVGIYDDLTGGNLMKHGALDDSIVINNGSTFKINAGDLDVILD